MFCLELWLVSYLTGFRPIQNRQTTTAIKFFFKWKKTSSSTSCSDKSPVKVCGLDDGGKIVFKLVNNEGSVRQLTI